MDSTGDRVCKSLSSAPRGFPSLWIMTPFLLSSPRGSVQEVVCAPNTSSWAEGCLKSLGQKTAWEEQPASCDPFAEAQAQFLGVGLANSVRLGLGPLFGFRLD